MKAAAIAIILAAVLGIGVTLGAGATGSHYRAKIAKMQHEHAEREAAIANAVLETQTAEIAKMQEVLNHANEQAHKARADADSANAANRKLREQLAAYRARHANTTASTGQGEPDSDPIGVLADLLGRCGERVRILARVADERRDAGLECERRFDALTVAP